MASPILTYKYTSQLSSSPIRKPTVSTLSNSVSFSSTRVHHLGVISLSQWSGLRQLSISISHGYVKFGNFLSGLSFFSHLNVFYNVNVVSCFCAYKLCVCGQWCVICYFVC